MINKILKINNKMGNITLNSKMNNKIINKLKSMLINCKKTALRI